MKRFLSGNDAVAEAVRLCRTQMVAAYPITPQTPIYERLSEWEATGELGGIMMRAESEHSAMAACLSASLTGVRTFTATSSQGLALMHEMLHFAAGCRTAYPQPDPQSQFFPHPLPHLTCPHHCQTRRHFLQ